MANFGQRVKLEVFDKSFSKPIFSSESLRIDFQVRMELGISKSKVSIFNLNTETVKNLINGERYMTLSVALHDQDWQVLVDKMFISNSYKETIVPSEVVYLFGYDIVRRRHLEKNVATLSKKNTLEGRVASIAQASGYLKKIEFLYMPQEVLDHVPPRTTKVPWSGTFEKGMEKLGKEFGFLYFTRGENIIVQALVDFKDLSKSSVSTKAPDIVLETNNMRSSPKIGIATCQFTSNLDVNLLPAKTFDTKELVTASVGVSEDTLNLVDGILKNTVSGYSIYQVVTSEFSGSNYTGKWNTIVTGVAPRSGTKMKTANWYG